MAKQRRFFTKAFIGMSAVSVLAVMMPTPARAETIELLCISESTGSSYRVSIDTDRQSVVRFSEDKPMGTYAASISDTRILWTERHADWEYQYTIDRGTGTINSVDLLQGKFIMNRRSQCRRATQKF